MEDAHEPGAWACIPCLQAWPGRGLVLAPESRRGGARLRSSSIQKTQATGVDLHVYLRLGFQKVLL